MLRRLARWLAIGSFAVPFGCGPGSLRAAGTSCSTDGQCAAGLQCLPLTAATGDAGCTAFVSVCSKTCQTDPDCARPQLHVLRDVRGRQHVRADGRRLERIR